MLINLLDKSSAGIILLLAVSPGSRYTRSELKEKTGMNNLPLDKALAKLAGLRMINENNRLYSLNMDNPIISQILPEIKEKFSRLPLKVQFILIEFLGMLLGMRPAARVVLFGSYSKLIFSEKSDIDLAIILPEKAKSGKSAGNAKSGKGMKNAGSSKNAETIKKKISAIGRKISIKYKKEIQEHFFSESDMSHKEDPLIRDILRNGVELV